jgi:hypothetical protein
MKKSKVLIPAMALLLFSTAASITGTVAWFTSTRTFTSNVGDFEVARLDGNLECTQVTNMIGVTTPAAPNAGTSISPATGALLTDASYDHVNNVLYTDVADEEGTYTALTEASTPAGTSWLARDVDSKHFYYGFTWTYTFAYTFAAESKMNLYFDAKTSVAKCFPAGNSGDEVASAQWDTIKGWRMAFVATNKTVWAPFRAQATNDNGTDSNTSDDYKEIRYIGGTDTEADYLQSSRKDLMDMDYKGTSDATIPAAGKHDTAHNNYLGQITKPDSPVNGEYKNTINVKVVTWYEGTDALITTRNAMSFQRARATLKFTVREAA